MENIMMWKIRISLKEREMYISAFETKAAEKKKFAAGGIFLRLRSARGAAAKFSPARHFRHEKVDKPPQRCYNNKLSGNVEFFVRRKAKSRPRIGG